MLQLELLPEPAYSPDEQQQLVAYVLRLHNDLIRKFLGGNGLLVSGNKLQLRERIEESIKTGVLSYAKLVSLLDSVEPWGDQHIILLEGPKVSLSEWKSVDKFQARLKQHRLGKLLNKCLPLILPADLALSCIEHSPRRLRVTCVERRVAWHKDDARNYKETTQEGETIEYRAFVQDVRRGIIAFEWDLITNKAFLQITELPSHSKYEDAQQRFTDLVSRWIDLKTFSTLDLHPAISRLHEQEEAGKGETRSHGIDYTSPAGRRLVGRSASADSSLLGEPLIDSALKNMRDIGIGRTGNFYFVSSKAGTSTSPIEDEVHAVIWADQNRIHFTKANDEKIIRYVLQRIQTACGSAP
jgi:hypothetical protein